MHPTLEPRPAIALVDLEELGMFLLLSGIFLAAGEGWPQEARRNGEEVQRRAATSSERPSVNTRVNYWHELETNTFACLVQKRGLVYEHRTLLASGYSI